MSNKYLGDEDLIYNTSTRIPVCLCIDTSGSMNLKDDGKKSRIEKLKKGIEKLYTEIKSDEIAYNSVEISLVGFRDTPYIISDFYTIDNQPKDIVITAQGKGNLGLGVKKSLELLNNRKLSYKRNGIDYYQPWLIIMSDGHSTGDGNVKNELKEAQEIVLNLEKEKKLTVIPVFIGIDLEKDIKAKAELGNFSSKNSIQEINSTKFSKFFEWLGKSVSAIIDFEVPEQIDFSGLDDWEDI